jgi:hypothetical protein
MGEYANGRGGRRIKLGTCENLFYVTRADVEALHRDGWRGDGMPLTNYLSCKVSRFALPKPGDVPGDHEAIENRQPDYPHRYRLRADADVVEALRCDVDHGQIYAPVNGTNFIIPCPLGKDWNGTLKTSPLYPAFDLIAEGANGRAIYACPYCGRQFNLVGHAMQARFRQMFDDQHSSSPQAEYLRRLIDWQPTLAAVAV